MLENIRGVPVSMDEAVTSMGPVSVRESLTSLGHVLPGMSDNEICSFLNLKG